MTQYYSLLHPMKVTFMLHEAKWITILWADQREAGKEVWITKPSPGRRCFAWQCAFTYFIIWSPSTCGRTSFDVIFPFYRCKNRARQKLRGVIKVKLFKSPIHKEFLKNQYEIWWIIKLKNGQTHKWIFTEKEKEMGNKYMKRCVTSLIIKEIQVKTITRPFFPPSLIGKY